MNNALNGARSGILMLFIYIFSLSLSFSEFTCPHFTLYVRVIHILSICGYSECLNKPAKIKHTHTHKSHTANCLWMKKGIWKFYSTFFLCRFHFFFVHLMLGSVALIHFAKSLYVVLHFAYYQHYYEHLVLFHSLLSLLPSSITLMWQCCVALFPISPLIHSVSFSLSLSPFAVSLFVCMCIMCVDTPVHRNTK